jgi:hypothetical protein
MLRFKTNHASLCYALYVKAGFASKELYRISSTLDSKNQFHQNSLFSFGHEKYCHTDATLPLRAQFACFMQSSFNKCRWICFVNFPEMFLPCVGRNCSLFIFAFRGPFTTNSDIDVFSAHS